MSAFAKRTSRTYAMPERSDRLDFYIRDQTLRSAITEPHKHDYFQIQINLGGDTKQQVGDVTRPFPTGSVAFIAPHRLHMIPHPEHSRFIVINFALDFLGLDVDAVDGRIDLGSIPIIRFPELAPFRFQDEMDFRLTGSDLVEVERIVHLMMEIDSARGFGATSRLRGFLLQLIGLVCARYADPLLRLAALNERAVSRRDSISKVMRHVLENLEDDTLSLGSAADAAALTPGYVARLMKKETGRTFVQWVTDQRISRAKALLADDTRRVKDIAFVVGFRDEAYFTRRFRQAVGTSPTEYRALQFELTAGARPIGNPAGNRAI
jgi:AraC-like DNA-binding protein